MKQRTKMKQKDNTIAMNRKEYGLLSNIKFIYSILYKSCPIMRLLVVGAIVLSVCLPLIGNLVPAVAIDSITKQNSAFEFLLRMGILLFVYGILTFLQKYINSWSDIYIDYTQSKDFLLKLLMKSLTTDYDNIESQKQQRMINEASHAVNMYRQGVNMMYYNTPRLIGNAIGIILYATTITMLDLRILLLIILMSIVGVLFEKRARNIDISQKEEQFCLWGRVYYLRKQAMALEGGKDIRIYHMGDWFCNAFMKLVEKNRKIAMKSNNAWFMVASSDITFTLIRDLIAYSILVLEVINGRLNLAEFTFGLGIVSGLSSWIRSLRGSWSSLLSGTIMLRDYRKMIDYPDKFLREGGHPLPKECEWPLEIQFIDVSFRYEEADDYILKNLNFTIKPGKKIALVGHNGAGKTTLVKLLCGFYHPTTGKILVGGRSIEEYNLEEYHKILSTIFQEPYTLPLSIASNVSCVREEDTDFDKVRECLMKAGLLHDVEKMKDKEKTYLTVTFREDGIELSGGMLQKLMLARAMYKDAPVLILDEPTAALDPIAESAMYKEYNKITKNKSSIFISHRLASTKFCDRIIYLEKGEILETGTHDELLQMKGKYAHIFQVQSQYYKEEVANNENTFYA